MVDYDKLPLSDELKSELKELYIDYAFQPIFYPDGKTVFAREALMRPKNCTVLELIDKYTKADKLHILEVATLFGAVSAFKDKGFTEYVTINSFPAECLSDDEEIAFKQCFGDEDSRGIIEVLEYSMYNPQKWKHKADVLKRKNLTVALDDFGVGTSNTLAIDIFSPSIVKLDRTIIADIHDDALRQEKFYYYLDYMHKRNVKVLAEGVETKEEFDFLVNSGVDLFQGYYLAKPQI